MLDTSISNWRRLVVGSGKSLPPVVVPAIKYCLGWNAITHTWRSNEDGGDYEVFHKNTAARSHVMLSQVASEALRLCKWKAYLTASGNEIWTWLFGFEGCICQSSG